MKQFFEPIALLLYIINNKSKNISKDVIDCIPFDLKTYILSQKNLKVNETSETELQLFSTNINFEITYPFEIIENVSQWLLKYGKDELKTTNNEDAIKSVMLISFIEIDVPVVSASRKKHIIKNFNEMKAYQEPYFYENSFSLPDKSYFPIIVKNLKKINKIRGFNIVPQEQKLVLQSADITTNINVGIIIVYIIQKIKKKKERAENVNDNQKAKKKKQTAKLLKNASETPKSTSSTIPLTQQ